MGLVSQTIVSTKTGYDLLYIVQYIGLPVGSPSTKYRSGPGLNFRMVLRTYLAAHSEASSYLSKITSLILAADDGAFAYLFGKCTCNHSVVSGLPYGSGRRIYTRT